MFSLHLCRAIEDHLGEKGLSLPVNTDALKEGDNTCYLVEIFLFHCDFSCVLTTLSKACIRGCRRYVEIQNRLVSISICSQGVAEHI